MIHKDISRILGILLIITIQGEPSEWYRNDEMAILYEAMTKISSESLYTENHHIPSKDILKNYIHSIDVYGDYFSKKEYKAFVDTLSPAYAGVGMILYQEKRNAKILCIPILEKLKIKGIAKYDELISVDGHLVKEKNFYMVSSWIRGKVNSDVVLEVQKSSGKLQTITLKRTEQHFHSIQRVIEDGSAMIRIIRFTHETPQELRNILNQWPKNIPIVIDLRGNGGGDLFAAIQSADLFLPKDTLIASVETTKRHIDYRAVSFRFYRG